MYVSNYFKIFHICGSIGGAVSSVPLVRYLVTVTGELRGTTEKRRQGGEVQPVGS